MIAPLHTRIPPSVFTRKKFMTLGKVKIVRFDCFFAIFFLENYPPEFEILSAIEIAVLREFLRHKAATPFFHSKSYDSRKCQKFFDLLTVLCTFLTNYPVKSDIVLIVTIGC